MEQESSESSAQRHLVVGDIVSESFRSVFSTYVRNLPAAAAAPFLLSMAIAFVFGQSQLVADLTHDDELSARNILLTVIFVLVRALPYILFAVAWHRLILLGPTAAPSFIPVWSRRHWRFFGFFFLLSFLTLVILGVLVGLPVLIIERVTNSNFLAALATLALLIPAGALALRLCLVLPAVAVDVPYGFKEAMRDSENQGFRLVAVFVVALIPFAIAHLCFRLLFDSAASDPLEQMMASTKGQAVAVVAFIVSTVIHYLTTAVDVTFISISFRYLHNWRPATPANSVPKPD